jgi:hypothetical protein
MNLAGIKDTYKLLGNVAAGVDGSAVLSSAIDCQSFDRVYLEVSLGAVVNAAVFTIKITECDTSGGSYTDISGATITQTVGGAGGAAASDKIWQIDAKLSKRYVKVSYQRTVQNVDIDSVILSLYDGKRINTDKSAVVHERVIV